MNQPEPTRLSRADAEMLDRLLAGESLADLIDANEPNRAEHVSRLLSLLDQWEASDAGPGLAQRTLTGVLTADPVSLSAEDGQTLDALLDLRRKGLADGPMPSGVRERVGGVEKVLGLLDRAADEPVPADLTQRTMRAIERDREAQQQRASLSTLGVASDRAGSIGIRQIATTAALLLMAVSILLPMLDKAQHDAEIAQCSENLAGLGGDVQQIVFDFKGENHEATEAESDVYNPFARLARTRLDGSTVPANKASFFILLDEQRIKSQHLSCPAGVKNDPASLYSGQNPAAGGPFQMFLKNKRQPIFSDANPLYRVAANGLVRQDGVDGTARSINHDGRGQNVLINDGSVQWMIRPVFNHADEPSDNIWLYEPNSEADEEDEVFLTP